MSAQHPPHGSGPHRPHREHHPPRGANPLRRTSDRVEVWCSRLLLVLLVLGLPSASVWAGLSAYESTMRTVQSQSAERHRITARVTSAPDAASDSAAGGKQTARVSWTDQDGRKKTGTARVSLDKTAGSTVRIWVDKEGTVRDPPLSAGHAAATSWLTGGLTALGVSVVVVAGRKGVRLALNRRRYAQWDAEWELVEPSWSARFHG
jgi:hypothetical protein